MQQRQTHRAFGLTLSLLLLVVTGVLWKGLGLFVVGLPVLSLSLVLIALIRPKTLWPLNRIWAATIARFLSAVLNYTILAGMFFLVVLPVGLLRRLLGGDTLGRRVARPGASYYRPVEQQVSAETLREIF